MQWYPNICKAIKAGQAAADNGQEPRPETSNFPWHYMRGYNGHAEAKACEHCGAITHVELIPDHGYSKWLCVNCAG